MALSDTLEQLCSKTADLTGGRKVNRREFLKGFGTAGIAFFGLDSFSSAVDSSEDDQNKERKYNVFKFYLDPRLVPNMEFARRVLPKYVDDMNYILQKNTNLKLLFNPETGIILTSTQPHSDNAWPAWPVPTKGFEIWAHAKLCDRSESYGGYPGMDKSGAGVLAALNWLRIYDPDKLMENSMDLRNYWIQINNMLHELGHVFEAGSVDDDDLALIRDTTGVEPTLDICFNDPNDSYWKDKADYKKDPMVGNILLLSSIPMKDRAKSRAELLETVQYSKLTAAFINGQYRDRRKYTIPDLKNIRLRVIDEDNLEHVPKATVNIFKISCISPHEYRLLVDKTTNNSGELIFNWGAPDPFNNEECLRLIKVSKEGYKPQAKYISIFDLQEAKLLHNKDIFNVDIQLIAE